MLTGNCNTNDLVMNMLIYKKMGERKGISPKASKRIGIISSCMIKGDSFTRLFLGMQMLKLEEESVKLRNARAALAKFRNRDDDDDNDDPDNPPED